MNIGARSGTRQKDVWIAARIRLATAIGAGLIGGALSSPVAAWQVSSLIGWCIGAATFLGIAWAMLLRSDSERTREVATRVDETRLTADVTVLSASIASLLGVGFILLKASSAKGAAVAAMTALAALAVVLAWAMVHTVFTLRYADLYYSHGGGIDFNDDEDPDYRDFAYLAFTIGMTFQVSDTDLQSKVIRHTAMRHGLLSYLFGASIIAMTINIVAGLAR